MVRATASNFSVQQQVEEIILIDTNNKPRTGRRYILSGTGACNRKITIFAETKGQVRWIRILQSVR